MSKKTFSIGRSGSSITASSSSSSRARSACVCCAGGLRGGSGKTFVAHGAMSVHKDEPEGEQLWLSTRRPGPWPKRASNCCTMEEARCLRAVANTPFMSCSGGWHCSATAVVLGVLGAARWTYVPDTCRAGHAHLPVGVREVQLRLDVVPQVLEAGQLAVWPPRDAVHAAAAFEAGHADPQQHAGLFGIDVKELRQGRGRRSDGAHA